MYWVSLFQRRRMRHRLLLQHGDKGLPQCFQFKLTRQRYRPDRPWIAGMTEGCSAECD